MTKKWIIVAAVLLISMIGIGWTLTVDPPCITSFEKRFAFSRHLTSAQKAAYWQTHLQNVLNTYELTSEQSDVIAKAQALATEQTYDEGVDEEAAASTETPFGSFYADVQANFTQQERVDIFETLPEYEPAELTTGEREELDDPERPSACNCSTWMSSCGWYPGQGPWGNGYGCGTTMGPCTPIGGSPFGGRACGYMWTMPCTGRCMFWGDA